MANNVYVYHTSPNQKSIITHKTVSDDAHIYGKCNVDATMSAAKELSDRAFKLYVRLNLHQDGHTYALSPVAIQGDIGMSDKRYREAVKELIDKGYLVQHDKHKSLYIFYEYPQKDDSHYRQRSERADNPAESAVSSTQNGRITRPNREDNPAILGGEIEHNITSHTTNNITSINNTCMDVSPKKKYRAPIDDILDDAANYISNPWNRPEVCEKRKMITPTPNYGMNNAEPEKNDTDINWDDELPF